MNDSAARGYHVRRLVNLTIRSRFRGALHASWRGFTLIEVVVALVIILILAAVALPQVDGYLQQKRVDATIQQLTTIANAITQFNNDLGSNTNPGRLSELSSPIIAGNNSYATGTDDSCGGTFTTTQRNLWNSNGPFVNFFIDRDFGMVTPIGNATDSLTRLPNSGTAGEIQINFVNSVDVEDAELLDATIDPNVGPTVGSIQWILPAVDGLVTMHVRIPINNDC